MPTTESSELLSRVGRELQRIQVRARNGLRHVGGVATGTTAATPRTVIWRQDNVVLYRYDSDCRSVATPILLVMSLVTKAYVLDLRPGSSLVEDLLAAGHDVFLIDWGVPEPVDSHNGIETYTDHYIPRAAEAALDAARATEITLLGYCMGGLFALLSVAGNPNMAVRNVVALATPMKVRDLSPMTTVLAERRMEPEHMFDETGNIPASVVKESLRIVNPTQSLTTYANLWQSLSDDEALSAHNALIGWSNDHIPFPGKAFAQFTKDFIRDGAPLGGTAPVGDRIVRLAEVRCPVLSVVGSRDLVVPAEASEPLASLLPNADFEELVLPVGHAGLFVGRYARSGCVPSIVQWLAKHE